MTAIPDRARAGQNITRHHGQTERVAEFTIREQTGIGTTRRLIGSGHRASGFNPTGDQSMLSVMNASTWLGGGFRYIFQVAQCARHVVENGVSKNVSLHSLQSWPYKARRPASGRWICYLGRSWVHTRKGTGQRKSEAQRSWRRCGAASPHGWQCPLCRQQANQRDFSAGRAERAKSQYPIAAVLSCSDSRVAPEFAFDQGPGDLVRLAGNFANDDGLASLEYAVKFLGVPLVITRAHELRRSRRRDQSGRGQCSAAGTFARSRPIDQTRG
jgi:hypothetical protein